MSDGQTLEDRGAEPPSPAGDQSFVVENLTTEISRRQGSFAAVDNVSFSVRAGEILGLVGESGCGKTMTALSVMRLLPQAATITGGRVLLGGRDVTKLKESAMRDLRGKDIAMVFQEPMSSLDPSFTIGTQLTEAIRAHRADSKQGARDRAVAMLEDVGIPRAADRLDDYPHQYSGGMRQRVMLALALLLEPKILIADEPTTALDVTIQAQILDLVLELREEHGMSVVLITHDLGVVHEVADRVAVMYAGEIVESAPAGDIFASPRHPYTQGLLRSLPELTERGTRLPVIKGRVPELHALPKACRFAPRCPNQIEPCEEAHPQLERTDGDRELRCVNPTDFELKLQR